MRSLFATIFYLLFALFHWKLGHKIMMFMFLSGGVFFGVIAGILTATPFGHGLQCKHNADHFSEPWRRFAGECARIQAIVGLSWALFGLNTIGFFWAIADKFSCVSKRDYVYAPYVAPEGTDVEKGETEAAAAH
ncbi:hypothetical protein A1Q2_07149 [Trichosporon asahii var. asahii CBS 8904]|uniref:Uncharacterized protein n=2 Tax=Trichosporon asahii var. asahii TaxID=189963 RepID=K1WA45_TRIAC|nr:hypothetical protein A1Q1_07769 [Trichosporon asahii var. asahii CBS 2479]EJT51034.1 hypothetical protein A1Q1_07769 [Trichosporon asahii var. asahii CBS 2479]EKC98553.1 hypothetical protein A1Q2_07149 [Trichosporon asahii var. asahii CBS 8904]